MIINNIIIKWGRRRANLQRLMNWWCLKGCCNSPLVMCNPASRSKALTVVLSKYLPLWHGKVVTITSGPLWLTSCRCWPDACALHSLWAQKDANVPLAQRIHALYTLTHTYTETHTLCVSMRGWPPGPRVGCDGHCPISLSEDAGLWATQLKRSSGST